MKKIFPLILLFIILMCAIFFIKPNEKNKHSIKNKKIDIKVEGKKEKKMSIVAVGDCLIHGALYMDARTGSNTYDFSGMISEVEPLIKDYDLKFFNQESIIGGKDLGVSHYPRFNSPDEIGDAMVNIGFNMVSLANNHTLDMGEKGILYSNEYWNNKKIIKSGTNSSEEERNNIQVYKQNDIKYGYLAYTTVTNGLSAPEGKDYLINVYDKDQVKVDIDKIKDKVDVIIVSMHWGEEYTHTPVTEEKEIAEYLSDLGVNLIIGTHPHVIQPVQYVNDTLVIYSLGNFISGQKPMGLDKIIGLMVGMDIKVKNKKVSFDNIKYNLLYTYSTSNDKNYRVIPFSNLNDEILLNYKEIENEYMDIVKSK